MPITFTCPCGNTITVADPYAGRQTKCPACGRMQPVPAPGAPVAVAPPKTSGLAIAALVLGILGFLCGLTAMPGLILGIVALSKVGRSQGRLKGTGLAIAGICVSAAWLIIIPSQLVPVVLNVRYRVREATCMANLRAIGLAIQNYTTDKNRFPTSSRWCDELVGEYLRMGSDRASRCPEAPESRWSYAFNEQLGGKSVSVVQDPSRTVLVFESDGGWNASGGRERMISTPRHLLGYNILFVDGEVRSVPPAEVDDLIWDPFGPGKP